MLLLMQTPKAYMMIISFFPRKTYLFYITQFHVAYSVLKITIIKLNEV